MGGKLNQKIGARALLTGSLLLRAASVCHIVKWVSRQQIAAQAANICFITCNIFPILYICQPEYRSSGVGWFEAPRMAAYSSSKLAVKESYDDEEMSDDVEDEVFIRDGRNGFKLDEEMGVKRPLMAPRRKAKPSGSDHLAHKAFYTRCLSPYCYVLIAVAVFLGIICVLCSMRRK